MNSSYSSSLSSPPVYKSNSRPQSSTDREFPSIIPLDYSYQIMAPSSLRPQTSRYNVSRASTHQNYTDVEVDLEENLPYSSLFGDPVPPPTPDHFLTSNLESSPYLRSNSVELTSEEEHRLGRTVTLSGSSAPQRLFPQVPYTTLMGRRFSNSSSQRNCEVITTNIPRLKPPDIQVLPNSSEGSSSDHQNPANYLLFNFDDKAKKPEIYDDNDGPADISELKETYTISDAHSIREFTHTTTKKTSVLQNTTDVESLSPPQYIDCSFPLQHSNESYSSGEWFRSVNSDYPEFNKMPKLRPSSKNVMSIKRDEMPMNTPVAAIINDSNASSSSEDRLMESTNVLDTTTVCLDSLQPPVRPPSPSPSCLRSLEETIVLPPREYVKQRRKSVYQTQLVAQTSTEETVNPPPIPPKPHFIEDHAFGKTQTPTQSKREVSPVIIKDSITTGGDYRVDQSRLHKKSSFTIINDKSAESSFPQSPKLQRTTENRSASLVPTKQRISHKNQLQQKSLSSTQIKLPHLIPPLPNLLGAADSPRLSVQFDMSGKRTASKIPPQKGILQNKDSLTSSQDTLLPHHMRRRSSIFPQVLETKTAPHVRSCEVLPLITDPYRTSIPRPHRSSIDLDTESADLHHGVIPRPVKPNPNPTRKQKGLLKVLNYDDTLSRLPLKSNWSSMDDLWLEQKRKQTLLPVHDKTSRRRSSSTSPSRRSSTQTTSDRRSSNISSVTTSDFSFRLPSETIAPKMPLRRKSIFQLPSPATRRKSSSTSSIMTAQSRPTRTKIAKPTTLSPIIGTPNKDSSSAQSTSHVARATGPPSDSISDSNSRRDSLSKIPIRSQTSSRSTSRISTHGESTGASRTDSRGKGYSDISNRSKNSSASKGYKNSEGRSSKFVLNDERYARTGPQMREYIEAGGSLPQLAITTGIHSKTVYPTKDYKQKGLHPSHKTSRNALSSYSGSPSKNYQELSRRSKTDYTLRSYQDNTDRRSSKIPTSRSGSRSSQYLNSHLSSRVQSQANSRDHSRSTSRASTRPISLPSSRPSSRMDLAMEIANSRSNSRLSMHSSKRLENASPVGRQKSTTKEARKSVSLSPQNNRRRTSRRGSLSPLVKKTKSGRSRSRSKVSSVPNSLTRSHIPVIHSSTRSPTKSTPNKSKTNLTNDLRKTSSLKLNAKTPIKQPASAKKITTSIRKPETSVKRTPSSVGKQSAVAKQQTSVPQISAIAKNRPANIPGKSRTNTKPISKDVSSLLVLKKDLNKKASVLRKYDGNQAQIDKKSKVKNNKNADQKREAGKDSPAFVVKEEILTEKAEQKPNEGSSMTAAPVAVLTTLKRHPSTVSLIRVSSKISLLKKRSDSKKSLDLVVPDVETGDAEASTPSQQLMEMALGESGSIPAAIIEKSQKTLENVQKTVTEATEEIQKTINENLTDLKSLEQDMGFMSDSAGSPTPSVTTVVEKKPGSTRHTGKSASRQGTAEDLQQKILSKSPLPPTQPIEAAVSIVSPVEKHTPAELAMSNGSSKNDVSKAVGASERVSERAISVLAEVDCESANLQSYQSETRGDVDDKLQSAMESDTSGIKKSVMRDGMTASAAEDYENEVKRRSPDGQGGSQVGSGKGSGSQEYLESKFLSEGNEPASKGCCRCCAKFCMPCRRLRCSRCCQRKKALPQDEAEQPVLSATSSATTTHLEIIDENPVQTTSCWHKFSCCKSCRKKSKDSTLRQEEEVKPTSFRPMGPPKQSKCGLCLSKIFCCRSVNKIDPKTGDETEVKKCCFCIPCRKKREMTGGSTVSSVAGGSAAAWQDPERALTATDAAVIEGQNTESRPGCCRRFCNYLLCCRKKKVAATDSRRPSIRPAPPEDKRRKLHADLIEYTSKMKGAIPVLPLWLAWFCAICNAIVPGLGTLLSGLFCLCVGIPRFSQYDSAKARLGSFIINTIVAVSQLFCVLFCFVGWGWSIWWGTIMLKCARKLSKIRKVERLEMEEEKRQAAAAEAAAALADKTTAPHGPSEPQRAKS